MPYLCTNWISLNIKMFMMYIDNQTNIVTGNFGVVYMAWCTKDNIRTKVAIKTLKGNSYGIGNM